MPIESAENWNKICEENWQVILEKIKRSGSTGMNLGSIARFAKKKCQKGDYFVMFLENGIVDLIMKGILKERKHEYVLESHYVWNLKNKGRGKKKCLNDGCETLLSIYNNGSYCFKCGNKRNVTKVVSPWLLERR